MGLESSVIASGYPMRTELHEEFSDKSLKRCEGLCNASKINRAHEQFLTGIRVNFDLTCTNKMWVEAERYRFLEFVSSQSTMHRITKFNIKEQCNKYVDEKIIRIVEKLVNDYNYCMREDVKESCLNDGCFKDDPKAYDEMLKDKYLGIVYNIPSGFELTARLTTNYRCLKNIYLQRKSHRLPEWREFCEWIETLPYFKEFLVYNVK